MNVFKVKEKKSTTFNDNTIAAGDEVHSSKNKEEVLLKQVKNWLLL